MALEIEERKARRIAGMERAKSDMTAAGKAQRIHRSLTTGRPPVSEMKSPTAAIGAARALHQDLKRKMTEEGLDPAAVRHGVAIAYVSPDLTVLGYTALFAVESQDRILRELAGQVPVGLLFGIVDENQGVLVGTRSFLNTKQAEEWLTELRPAFPQDVLDPA